MTIQDRICSAGRRIRAMWTAAAAGLATAAATLLSAPDGPAVHDTMPRIRWY